MIYNTGTIGSVYKSASGSNLHIKISDLSLFLPLKQGGIIQGQYTGHLLDIVQKINLQVKYSA